MHNRGPQQRGMRDSNDIARMVRCVIRSRRVQRVEPRSHPLHERSERLAFGRRGVGIACPCGEFLGRFVGYVDEPLATPSAVIYIRQSFVDRCGQSQRLSRFARANRRADERGGIAGKGHTRPRSFRFADATGVERVVVDGKAACALRGRRRVADQ